MKTTWFLRVIDPCDTPVLATGETNGTHTDKHSTEREIEKHGERQTKTDRDSPENERFLRSTKRKFHAILQTHQRQETDGS